MDPNLSTTLDAAKATAVVAGLVQVCRYVGLPARFLPVASILAGLMIVLLMALGQTGSLIVYGLGLGLGATGIMTAVVHAGTGSTGGSS